MTRPAASLPEDIRQEIVEHCLSALPNEGCGLLAVDGHRIVATYPTANQDASPRSYTIPPEEHYRALIDAEGKGWKIGGVFHSHPSGPAAMSAVDIERALEPDWMYVVVGLEGRQPNVVLTFLPASR